jgi:simple sugar transport system permease protein
MIDNIIFAAIAMTTPVLLAALGGLVNRVGGIVNIGLDSMMLAGALAGLIVASMTGSSVLAVLAAALIGAVLGLLMSLAVTRLDANEIIVGLGFNVAVAGLVRFFLKTVYDSSGTLNLPGVARLPGIDIPVLANVPFLGALVSGHDALSWLAWIMVPATVWFLARTRLGLRLRAAGAAPQAGDSSRSRRSISGETGRGPPRSAPFCSASSMPSRSGCRAAACRPNWCRRCLTSW